MALSLYQFLLFLILLFSSHFESHLHSYATALLVNNSAPSQHMCPPHESSALLQFKQSFLIDCTTSKDASAYSKVKFWSSEANFGNCCLWDGVVCSKESGHVIGLSLGSSCLYGILTPNSPLFSLSHLQYLDLSFNNFNNSVIPFELENLSNLRTLNLSSSALNGQIPSGISKLSKLSYLDLSYNFGLQNKLQFDYATLERLLRNVTGLRTLFLDGVDISSTTPTILANLTYLEKVSFQSCNLYGQFPTSIFHLPHLEDIRLMKNFHLEGSLPEFQQNSSLRNIDLSKTAFDGELPDSIGKLVHLESLVLYRCSLSGQIPSSLGHLTNLITLNLGYNDFSGEFPPSLTNLTNLQVLSLSSLKVRPEKLFSSLFKLNKLTDLELMGMDLGNKIPSSFANFTSLTTLDLSANQITGPIPNWLMNLTNLQWLHLQNNQLSGRIPSEWISQLSDLVTISLKFNDNLYGTLEPFLKLRNLSYLELGGVHMTSLATNISNVSVPKLKAIGLNSCNLTEFPQFLRSQDGLAWLDLGNNNIHGLIPQWLLSVTRQSLNVFDLSHNSLTAFEHPVEVLPWSNLAILNLEDNQMQGSLPIPPRSIAIYQVPNNQFIGSIPRQICLASSMQYFDVSMNNLSGQIPSCISELADSLEVLNFKGNRFNGSIPRAYPESCNLKKIDFSENQLEGRMPRSLVNCSNLEVLNVGGNRINDTFPSWLGSLPNLTILILRQNNFHGKIGSPKTDLDFNSLRIIDLSNNYHTGDLPLKYLQNWDAMKITTESQSTASGVTISLEVIMAVGTLQVIRPFDYSITITNKGSNMVYTKILTVLRVIDFSSNNFTGNIPEAIGELQGLQALNLSNNHLHGGLPLSLANMIDLESLDLSNNMLSGDIPQGMTQLISLEVFNVSNNLLKGPIPQGRQFGTFDNSSFGGNSGLCGVPLSRKCDNVEEPSVSDDDDEEEDSHLVDWVIRGLGCAGGFAVGCAIGKYFSDSHHEWFEETFGWRRKKPKRNVRTNARNVRR